MKTVVARAAGVAGVLSIFLGGALGGFMSYAAISHNPQQTFYGAEWSSLVGLGLMAGSWFGFGFAVTFPVLFVLLYLVLGDHTPKAGGSQ